MRNSHSTPNVSQHIEDTHSQPRASTVEKGVSSEVAEDLWPELMPHGHTDSKLDVGEPDTMKQKAAGREEAVIKRKQETPEDEVESAEPVIRSDVAADETEQQAEDLTVWKRSKE